MKQKPWGLMKATQRAFPISPDDTCSRCVSPDNLQRHHKDRDRANNDPANVEILCQGCHAEDHINAGDWGRMKGRNAA